MTRASEKVAVPRLRFKGREGAWTRQPIGELFSERDERSAEGELLSVTIRHGVVRACDSGKADSSSADKSHYKVVKIRDLAYNSMRMWQGACGASKFDGIVSPAYTVIVPNAESDSEFFEYTFKRPEVLRQFQRNSQGMTSDTWNLKFPLLKDICISCPGRNTQVRIATAFRDFDKLILMEASHLTSLRQLKRAMLVKMFPRPGQCVPEIRFKGFEGKWEELRVRDVAERVTRKNLNQESDLPLTISAEHGLIDQREVFNSRIAAKDVSNYYLVVNGEFAYNRSTSDGAPFGAVKRLDRYAQGVLSTLYMVFALKTESVDSDYLVQYYTTDLWHRDIALRAAEGARNHGLLNISVEDFFDTRIIAPPSLPEQRKIAAFFRNFDRLIGAAEKKVAKLRQVKASLLERMFV